MCALCQCRAVCQPQKAAGGLSARDPVGTQSPQASGSGIAGKCPPATVAQKSGEESWFHLVDGYQAPLAITSHAHEIPLILNP